MASGARAFRPARAQALAAAALLLGACGVARAAHARAPATARRSALRMVAPTSKPQAAPVHSRWGDPAAVATDAPGVTTPTERGSTVDARRIVDQNDVSAMWLSHILVDTEPVAQMIVQRLRAGEADFAALAASASACEATRAKGGAIGWVSRDELEPHVDELLPPDAQALAFTLKPGDLFVAPGPRGSHVVRIDDVMMQLRTSVVGRRRLGGAGEDLTRLVDAWRERASGAVPASPAGVAAPAGLTYEMVTMGCQMNVADSERMAGSLEALGFRPLDGGGAEPPSAPSGRADLVVVNTCSIRDHAEQKVYSTLGPYAIRKRAGEPVAIVVAGCVAQQEGARLLRRVPEVDVVMGPQYSNRLGDLLEDALNGNQVVATEPTFIMEDVTKPRRASQVCAWVNIIYGCNERCTYCVVPGTRGVEQSRPPDAIRAEMAALGSQGYKEVTLLGQNIDAYGRDMSPKRRFADLLAHVAEVPGIERVRFVTSHPRYMSDSVVSAVAAHAKLMPVFHIPAQSGSDEVLKRMGRGYTAERYLQIVDRIREKLPDAAITSDFIVGTPGETAEEFEATLQLMEKCKFDAAMTAAYSPRPNTPMATWPDQLPDSVKDERLQIINRLVGEHALERSQRFLGRVEEVLVEERNVKRPTQLVGRTQTNRLVFFDGEIDELRGRLVNVRITEARKFSLSGELVR